MGKWDTTTTATLIERGVLEIGDGYRAKNSEFIEGGGLPFIRVGDVNDTVHLEGRDELPMERLDDYKPKVSETADSIITMKGSVGRVAFVREGMRPFVYSPQLSYWRSLRPDVLHPRWLRYWLESPEFVAQSRATKGATDMADYINLRDQRRMKLTLPPFDVQEATSGVLGTFDDLIENNRRRIEILEEMARLIYREWFVHFRFPGHENVGMADADLGRIPEGWEMTTLGEAAVWKSGGTPSTKNADYWDGEIPWITSGSLTSFLLDDSDRKLTPLGVENGSRVVDRDAILFVVRGMSLAKEFRHGIADRPVAFGQDCKALVAREGVEPLFLAFAISALAAKIQGMVEFAAHGTGKLSTDRIQAVSIPAPPAPIQQQFSNVVGPMRELMSILKEQIRALKSARDLLLPRLISGDLDVSGLDVELGSVA